MITISVCPSVCLSPPRNQLFHCMQRVLHELSYRWRQNVYQLRTIVAGEHVYTGNYRLGRRGDRLVYAVVLRGRVGMQ